VLADKTLRAGFSAIGAVVWRGCQVASGESATDRSCTERLRLLFLYEPSLSKIEMIIYAFKVHQYSLYLFYLPPHTFLASLDHPCRPWISLGRYEVGVELPLNFALETLWPMLL
jgi:hypothetical protein